MHQRELMRKLSVNQQRWKYVACDYATSFVAFFLFNIFRCVLLTGAYGIWQYVFSEKLVIEEITIPLGMLGIYWMSGYYNRPFGKSRLQELVTTLFSSLINTTLIYLILLINDQTGERTINYELLLMLVFLLFLLPYLGRLAITEAAIRHFKAHQWAFRTVIVGNSKAARETGKRLKEGQGRIGVNILGYLSLTGEEGIPDGGNSVLADGDKPETSECKERIFSLEELEELCRREEVDQLVIAGSSYNDSRVLHLLYKLFHLGIPIKIAPDTFSYVTSAIRLQDIFGEPFVDLTTPSLSESSKNVKRMSDVIFSGLVLLVFSPLYLLLALLVKLDSKGPVIYSQERIGLKQRPFKIYKFRTMTADAEKDGPRLAAENDVRITKIGKIFRKYRLDELPQFWNVLKGEMSIVGPRPERRFFIEQIMQKAPYYALVYQVRPGITSWGMVKYGYASTVDQMVERTRYDLIYMSNMSLFVDIKILIYTVKTVVTGRGM